MRKTLFSLILTGLLFSQFIFLPVVVTSCSSPEEEFISPENTRDLLYKPHRKRIYYPDSTAQDTTTIVGTF